MATSLRNRLPKVKPWAAVAAVLGVLLVGYAGLQVTQYLSAWNQRESSQGKIDELQRSLAAPLSDLAVLEQHVADRKRQLEDWAGEFSIERYELSVVDNDGATSTSVVHPSFLGDDGAELSLQLTPRFEYGATVEHSGNARHYRIGSDNPNLAVGHRGIRFNGGWVQDWLVRASEGEVVRLGVSTTGDNEGAPQATEIELSMFDAETGSTLLGPTSTALTLGSLHIFSYHNTSTARDIRVNLVPDGDFRLKKVGGDNREMTLRFWSKAYHASMRR